MKYFPSRTQSRIAVSREDLRVGSGQVIPKKFIPPNKTDTPQLLFPPMLIHTFPPVHRFIRRSDPTQVLIYTSGACLDNGRKDPRGGCAFVFKFSTSMQIYGRAAFRLENKGPTGQQHQQTSNRAELRAVIGALRFRGWNGEGFKTIVIATDSEYIVNCSTNCVRGWLQNGWKRGSGAPVEDKDLWLTLLGECERWSSMGLKIKFWQIPRECNTEADRLARDAAANEPFFDKFSDINGILV
ncbi:Ribonuclease H-like domain containing protein [Elaphomyces granulatus]